jgi:hypothetical protein
MFMKYLSLLCFLVACASEDPSRLSERAQGLEVFDTKPTAACRVVGKVVGVDMQGSKDLALNRALNAAAALEATGLLVNEEVPNGAKMTVHATAYDCD